jgi:hypothetical protein
MAEVRVIARAIARIRDLLEEPFEVNILQEVLNLKS